MTNLVIVESFTKTKTISKYLGSNFTVICSLGHINNLPKSDLGINTETWEGKYEPLNKKIISNLCENVKKASVIYIASDPDMEGEAIAYHIKQNIKHLLKDKKCYRVEFNEITKKAVTEALQNPHDINMNIVNAQESRRFVDRLVGYKLSPLLWQEFNDNTLSVGRVQSVALFLCVDLFEKINKHTIESFWTILGKFKTSNKNILDFKLYKKEELVKVRKKEDLHDLLKLLDFSICFETIIKERVSSESPPAPYTTTSLQQDAYNKLRYSAKKTMNIAQALYENGHITYMRTDSTHISNNFKNIIIKYINETYNSTFSQFRNHKNKIANAQEAHEAIRITNINVANIDLSAEHNALYKLIWKRTVASQMKNAEYDVLDIVLSIPNTEYQFIYKKSFLKKQGYLILYDIVTEDATVFKEDIHNLKVVEYICDANINTPPSLYNEVSLIKILEKEGIGRPSTYASIIEKIISKKYVEKGTNPQKELLLKNVVKTKSGIKEIDNKINVGGKNKDLLLPTELGMRVIDYLKKHIEYLLDIQFTAKMESTLDRICDQTMTKQNVLDDFYKNHILPLTVNIEKKEYVKPIMKDGIIKTKYGYCYYNQNTKKYTNIESYLSWRKCSAENLTEKDLKFIKSLPKKIENNQELHLGPYGLYIKCNGKNVKLDKSKWEDFLNSC
jgi:DNA topoisomerase-1